MLTPSPRVGQPVSQMALPLNCLDTEAHATLPADRGTPGAPEADSRVHDEVLRSPEGASLTLLRPAVATELGALYATDCFNLFSALKDESIDCVFADPPFNLGKDYGRGAVKDVLERRDYLKSCFAWIDECIRLLAPGGALFVYILPQWGYHLAAHIEERGMLFRHWIALSMKGTSPWPEAVLSSLRAPVLRQGPAEDVQPDSPSHTGLPALRKGHQGLWWPPKISEPGRTQPDGLSG